MEDIDKTFDLLKHGRCGSCSLNPAVDMHHCPYFGPEFPGQDCNCCSECKESCFFDGLSK